MATSPQGQSKATRPKQENLASFIAAHASIVSLIQAKAKWAGPYCYIDTNAGSGWNDQVNCPGSPLVALSQLFYCEGLSFRVFCIEKNEDSALRLRQELGSGHCVICEDHATALPQLDLPRSPYGLVYADPNALLDAPVEAMRAFFQRPDTKRIDVLININAVTVRRVVAGQRSGNSGSYDDLPGIMKRVDKSYWWIRDPYITAGSKWTFLFGSNSPRINIKKLGHGGLSLYPVDSPRGKSLLDSLTGSALPGKRSIYGQKDKNVFVCSMADLFGKWVPLQWIQQVMDAMIANPQWTYLCLTKFPQRLKEINDLYGGFPDHVWVGTSIDNQARVGLAERCFKEISARVKWLSCEPLIVPLQFGDLTGFDWVVIGGQSAQNGLPSFTPPLEWVGHVYDVAKRDGCKVFCKTENMPHMTREVAW